MNMKDYRAVLLSATLLLPSASAFSLRQTSAPALAEDLVRLRPGDGAAANRRLCRLLREEDRAPVRLDGVVSKRRAIGKHLVFLDIVPLALPRVPARGGKSRKRSVHDDLASATPVQAILRRDVWDTADTAESAATATTPSSFDVYQKILQPGVHLQLTGRAGPSRNANEAILFARSAKYALCNGNPQHLRNVLRYAREGVLAAAEVRAALPFVGDAALTAALGRDTGDDATVGSIGDLAKELLSGAPRQYLCDPSQLMGSTSSHKVKLLPPAPPEYGTAPPRGSGGEEADDDEVVSVASILREQTQATARAPPHARASRNIRVSGWVQNRRRYRGAIAVLELVDDFASATAAPAEAAGTPAPPSEEGEVAPSELKALWNERIYVVLHPEVLRAGRAGAGTMPATNSSEVAETYGNLLCAGARVRLEGYWSLDASAGAGTLWVTRCRLLHSSWRPSAVQLVLELLHAGAFAPREAAGACGSRLPLALAETIANGTTSTTERQWLSAELTRSLQGAQSRVGKVTSSMTETLESFAAIRQRYPIEKIDVSYKTCGMTPTESTTTSILQSQENPRHASREGSFWQRAKEPQLKFMIEQISLVLRSHPEYGSRKLQVVDIGGGKGLLSNLLAETFAREQRDGTLPRLEEDPVEVKVVDISHSATQNGMRRARRRGLRNIQYSAQDATTLDVTGVDVVVALHACGALSDVALGHAVGQGCGFVVCPCCFRSNPHLRVAVPAAEGGAGGRVAVEDWLAVAPARYAPLKQLAELQGDIDTAGRAMHTICGLRAGAVDRLWHNSRWPGTALETSIKAFPIGLSTRNLVLVGTFSKE